MSHIHNRFGKPLPEDPIPEPVDPNYCDSEGIYKWDPALRYGFDSTQPTSHITLKKGDTFLRYGKKEGSYGAPIGTPFEQLALPYKIRTCEYNEFEVVEDNVVYVAVRVEKGIVGKQKEWPSEPGGGIQYFFEDANGNKKPIQNYINEKALHVKEVSEWSTVLKQDIYHP